MDLDLPQVKRILEGILFVSAEPVTPKRLKSALPGVEPAVVRQLIDELNAEYAQRQHAFFIQEVAGGFRLVTDPKLAAWIKRAMELPREDGLSKRALETLAIIAYKQPITKAEIEAIRGVDVSGTLDTLLEHQFAEVVGRKDSPGRPLLYGTTLEFLRHFGLKSLKELPPMGDKPPTLPGSAGLPESEATAPASADESAEEQPVVSETRVAVPDSVEPSTEAQPQEPSADPAAVAPAD